MTEHTYKSADQTRAVTLTIPDDWQPVPTRVLLIWEDRPFVPFALVPPVVEPKGLGAVIRAKIPGYNNPLQFVRTDGTEDSFPWWSPEDENAHSWEGLTDVEILSEGWTP